MADFLSDAWIAAMAIACADAPDREPVATRDGGVLHLMIEPVIRDVPRRGEVRYRMGFDDSRCSVEPLSADAGAADVYLETDYPTAVALARGETNAQAALAAGQLRVTGDVARLAAHAAALARLDDVFASLRATTSYP